MKYDYSRAVTWVGDKSSCLLLDVMSHGHVSRHCAAATRSITSYNRLYAPFRTHLE